MSLPVENQANTSPPTCHRCTPRGNFSPRRPVQRSKRILRRGRFQSSLTCPERWWSNTRGSVGSPIRRLVSRPLRGYLHGPSGESEDGPCRSYSHFAVVEKHRPADWVDRSQSELSRVKKNNEYHRPSPTASYRCEKSPHLESAVCLRIRLLKSNSLSNWSVSVRG